MLQLLWREGAQACKHRGRGAQTRAHLTRVPCSLQLERQHVHPSRRSSLGLLAGAQRVERAAAGAAQAAWARECGGHRLALGRTTMRKMTSEGQLHGQGQLDVLPTAGGAGGDGAASALRTPEHIPSHPAFM